jgi:hypothetical protein
VAVRGEQQGEGAGSDGGPFWLETRSGVVEEDGRAFLSAVAQVVTCADSHRKDGGVESMWLFWYILMGVFNQPEI